MKKFLLSWLFAFAFASYVHAQNAVTLPYAAQAVADIGNGPIKVRVTQGNASIFTAQGSGVGGTSGSSTLLTLTTTPATAPLVGGLISGSGITSGTTVTAYNGTTGITLSAAVTVPASTAVSWGAACPSSAAGIPSQFIQASVMADYYLLYTQARVCAVSPGGNNNALLILPIFYDQTVASSVSSFNGRTGAVVPATNDYSFNQIAGNVSTAQLAPGAAASNVGTVGGALAGNLPNPTLATGASGCVVANGTSGPPAAPSCVASTSWLDQAFCNTVGYVITRISGVWTCNNSIPRNVRWFGAVGDGTTNDTAAIAGAITSLSASGGAVYFPAGFYPSDQFTAPANITFYGDGPGASCILARANSQTQILINNGSPTATYNTFRDFCLKANGFTSVNGLLNQRGSFNTFQNLNFVCQTLGLFIFESGYDFVENVQASGDSGCAAPLFHATAATPNFTSNLTVVNYRVNNVGTGVSPISMQLTRVISAEIDNFQSNNLTNGAAGHGIVIEDDSEGININGGQITKPSIGILTQISGGNVPSFITVTGTMVDQATSHAVAIPNGIYITLNGVQLTSSTVDGVVVADSFNSVVNSKIHGAANGIELNANAGNALYADNLIDQINAGGFAIKLDGGTSTNVAVVNNNVANAGLGGTVSDNLGAVVKTVYGNIGYAIAPSTVTPGASPYTYTSGSTPESIYLTGGVGSATVGGKTICAVITQCSVQLSANTSLVVTYTGVPSMQKQPQQ